MKQSSEFKEKNLEVKAVYNGEKDKISKRLQKLASREQCELVFEGTIEQTDMYFVTQDGSRLKTRVEHNLTTHVQRAYAVHYIRKDEATERKSVFSRYTIRDYDAFDAMFIKSKALTTICVVRKTRTLWFYKNARIHFDVVNDLKDHFVEIEVEIRTAEEEKESQMLMEKLLGVLKIKKEDMVSKSYVNLVVEANLTEVNLAWI